MIWNITAQKINDIVGGDKIVQQQEHSQTPRINILFIGASPNDQQRIRDDAEYKLILEKLDEERFYVKPILAATFADISVAVAEKPYDIWHFAAHGANKFLVIETPTHSTIQVNHQHIVSMLSFAAATPSLLVLNGCSTNELAQNIALTTYSRPRMISTVSVITDTTANLLSSSLYGTLNKVGLLDENKITFLLSDPSLAPYYRLI